MSSDHHAGDLALRSSKMMVNWDFEQIILLSKSSKPDKDPNPEVLWLGELYTTAAYPFLFCIVTSQTFLAGALVDFLNTSKILLIGIVLHTFSQFFLAV